LPNPYKKLRHGNGCCAYWIADYFIRHGEVVLTWQGLCWWGRTTTGQYVFMDKAVKQLFNCQSSFIPE